MSHVDMNAGGYGVGRDKAAVKASRNPLSTFWASWRACANYNDLALISDAELAKRGLHRSDLARAAAISAGLIKA